MMIKAKDLYYQDSFIFVYKGVKEVRCVLKHKKPIGKLIKLITNKGTFRRDPEELVELIPQKNLYSKGGWICKCLNIYPCTTKMCADCGHEPNPWQPNTVRRKSKVVDNKFDL